MPAMDTLLFSSSPPFSHSFSLPFCLSASPTSHTINCLLYVASPLFIYFFLFYLFLYPLFPYQSDRCREGNDARDDFSGVTLNDYLCESVYGCSCVEMYSFCLGLGLYACMHTGTSTLIIPLIKAESKVKAQAGFLQNMVHQGTAVAQWSVLQSCNLRLQV